MCSRPWTSARRTPTRPYATTPPTSYAASSATRSEIDGRIAASLKPGWTLERLPRVDRNALRISVFEIDFSDLPDEIAVSEAVHLVSNLSTDDSPTFVNGVLHGVIASKKLSA